MMYIIALGGMAIIAAISAGYFLVSGAHEMEKRAIQEKIVAETSLAVANAKIESLEKRADATKVFFESVIVLERERTSLANEIHDVQNKQAGIIAEIEKNNKDSLEDVLILVSRTNQNYIDCTHDARRSPDFKASYAKCHTNILESNHDVEQKVMAMIEQGGKK